MYFFAKHMAGFCELTCFTVVENQLLDALFKTFPVLGSSKNKFRYINIFLFFKLKKLLKQNGIHYLLIEHPYYGWLAWLLRKLAGIKIIVHSHNIEGQRFKDLKKSWWYLLACYEKSTHRMADMSFFISPEDRAYALKHFRLLPERCRVATYGIELTHFSLVQKAEAKQKLCKELEVDAGTHLILFNGTLNYQPNLDAVDRILQSINPLLKKKLDASYKIIICGKGLPESYNELRDYKQEHILFKGFVPDIHAYFAAADLFINPITDGGGIKTKLVEALGTNTSAVSYKKGAFGVPLEVTGSHLRIVADKDDQQFVKEIVAVLFEHEGNIPERFYDYFSWDKIAQRAVEAIENIKE